jgi:hypothetical protein
MPKIDVESLRPGSEAAQSAKQAWYAAVEAAGAHDKADREGYHLAVERTEAAREVYNDLCRDLARDVHLLLIAAQDE